MDKKRPTNLDIYRKLGAIEKQTTLTNGRVTRLEAWQNGIIGVAAYQEKNAMNSEKDDSNKNNTTDYTKIVLAALGLVGTALGVIGVMVAR